MIKLYCFQYDVNENKVYRQEFDSEEYQNDYFIHAENDETTFISANDIDQVRTCYNEIDKILYVYTLKDDVNEALSIINGALLNAINNSEKELKTLRALQSTFSVERYRILEKYPTGTKIEQNSAE